MDDIISEMEANRTRFKTGEEEYMDNFTQYSFKHCPYCGKDARLAEQNIETCHNGKHDPGVLGHYFTCECTRVWVDWYRYDETSR